MTMFSCVVLASLWTTILAQEANLDQFNYRETVDNDYGPEQWGRVRCGNLDECLGWPDSWKPGIEWELEMNHW